MLKNFNKRTQKGMTLIEMLVVLALGALIIIGGLSLFSTASDKQKVTDASRDIGVISAGVASVYSNEPSYAGLTNTVLTASGSIPNNLGTGAAINSSWGTIVVAPTVAPSLSYTITYATVPIEACVAFASSVYQSYELVTIGGTTVTSVALIIANCTASSTMVFTSR